MYRTIALTASLIINLFTGTYKESEVAVGQSSETEVVETTNNVSASHPENRVISEAFLQTEVIKKQRRANKKVAPIHYWDKVAQCETGGNWKDKGNWGGGLGMATQTWVGYGGRQFAPHPSQATRLEQIIVANRVSVLGFQTKNTYLSLDDKLNNRPFFRPPSGFYGWGCIKNNSYLKPTKKNFRKP